MQADDDVPLARRPWRGTRLPFLTVVTALLLIALAAALLWPEPPLDPLDPATWPVGSDKAVMLARGPLGHCPHTPLRAFLTGEAWRDAGRWEAAALPAGAQDTGTRLKAGILCLRSKGNLGAPSKVGKGAEDAPNSALYLIRAPRNGDCPAGTAYETEQECLSDTPLPPAPDIAP